MSPSIRYAPCYASPVTFASTLPAGFALSPFTQEDIGPAKDIIRAALEEYPGFTEAIKDTMEKRWGDLETFATTYGPQNGGWIRALKQGNQTIGVVCFNKVNPTKLIPHITFTRDGVQFLPYGPMAELQRIYLNKRYRGQKLGELMLKQAEKEAKNMGYTAIVMESHTRLTDAVKLYEKSGYQQITAPFTAGKSREFTTYAAVKTLE